MRMLMVDPDMWREYLVEAEDLLTTIEQCAIELEENPGDAGAVAEVFRCVHTLKGNSAFVGLKDVSDLCHQFESETDEIRKRQRQPVPEEVEAILDFVDVVRQFHARAEQGAPGTEPEAGVEPDGDGDDGERRWLVFSLGGSIAAVPVDAVEEVSQPLPVSRVPCADGWLCGLVNLRGQVVPVVDFYAAAESKIEKVEFLVVVHAEGARVGIGVQGIHGVFALVPQPHENVPAGWLPLFSAVARGPCGLVGIIDPSALLAVGVDGNAHTGR